MLTVVAAGALLTAQTARPNVIILFSDDQRADTIHAWNPKTAPDTPAMDSLVHRGFSFKTNYCMGGNSGAVCIPSRATLLMGRSVWKAPQDYSAQTMPETFRSAGYQTFMSGKWHSRDGSKAPFERGFETGKHLFFGGMSDHQDFPTQSYDGQTWTNTREATKGRFSSSLIADAVTEFIDNRDQSRPFFVYASFTMPHDPRQAPEEDINRYDGPNLPELPPNFMTTPPYTMGVEGIRDEKLVPMPRDPMTVRKEIRDYYGTITYLDRQIGRILTHLEEKQLKDNTIIVFVSDHGLAIGSHGLLGKQNVYEHSLRSPMIMAGPGVPHGETYSYSHVHDVFPTLLSLTRVHANLNLDSKDLSPLFRAPEYSVYNRVLLVYQTSARQDEPTRMRAVRQGRYKLLYSAVGNNVELFDLQSDPHETNNLAEDPNYANLKRNLWTLLKAECHEAGDPHELPQNPPTQSQILAYH